MQAPVCSAELVHACAVLTAYVTTSVSRGQAAAGPSAEAVIIPDAGHGMHGHERECVDAVMALLERLPQLPKELS